MHSVAAIFFSASVLKAKTKNRHQNWCVRPTNTNANYTDAVKLGQARGAMEWIINETEHTQAQSHK